MAIAELLPNDNGVLEAGFDVSMHDSDARPSGLVGHIEKGREQEHLVPERHRELMSSFGAMTEIIFNLDAFDDSDLPRELHMVEVRSPLSPAFLVVRNTDRNGNPTHAVLTTERHTKQVFATIDAGDALYTEGHSFRLTSESLVERPSDPIDDEHYEQVFGKLIDIVVSGDAEIVVIS